MKVHTSIRAFRSALDVARGQGVSIGFVPTMGALHEGHISLMQRARSVGDSAAVSIFVNPLQFGPNEDLSKYPRPLEADLEVCESAGVSDVFVPEVVEMYPNGALQTKVCVEGLSEVLEGADRPGHFDGVATVVTKLFSIVGHSNAYFGEKDWQQLQVVRQLVRELSLPVRVIGCPTVRESDGLAMSSRNVYLSDSERSKALGINVALAEARSAFHGGLRSVQGIEDLMRNKLGEYSIEEVGYAVVRDQRLQVPNEVFEDCRLLISARIGTTRLIDNMGL